MPDIFPKALAELSVNIDKSVEAFSYMEKEIFRKFIIYITHIVS